MKSPCNAVLRQLWGRVQLLPWSGEQTCFSFFPLHFYVLLLFQARLKEIYFSYRLFLKSSTINPLWSKGIKYLGVGRRREPFCSIYFCKVVVSLKVKYYSLCLLSVPFRVTHMGIFIIEILSLPYSRVEIFFCKVIYKGMHL